MVGLPIATPLRGVYYLGLQLK